MALLNRNKAFIKKLKKLGKPAAGRVTAVTAQSELRGMMGMPLGEGLPYTVVVGFTTEEGRAEQLVMHTSEGSSYAAGFEVPVIYYYENGVCFAAPAFIAEKNGRG